MPETPTRMTTRQKVERLFKPAALQRIEQAGLMLIDKDDFASLMQVYEEYQMANNGLRDEVKRLEVEVVRLRGQMQGRLL